jgi:hypothetical protein
MVATKDSIEIVTSGLCPPEGAEVTFVSIEEE